MTVRIHEKLKHKYSGTGVLEAKVIRGMFHGSSHFVVAAKVRTKMGI